MQKQVGSAADLSRVEVGELVRDILDYLHPMMAADVAFTVDIEPVDLPVEVATPLALLLNECLARIGSVASPGSRVEGRRLRPGRLALAMLQPGAAEAFALLESDRFIAMLVAQIDGSMTRIGDGDRPELAIELPIPVAG